MAGLFAISINPAEYRGNFLEDLFLGTFYHQHLGEEYAGLATFRDGRIQIRTHRGLFRPTFSRDMSGLEGTEGIGYCGPAREPYFCRSRLGESALCFSGNIINRLELVERFESFGHVFDREDDIGIIARIIVQGNDLVDGTKRMAKELAGAYSLFILTRDGIYALRSSKGHWPLIIGEKEGAVIVASESGGFSNFGFKTRADLEPGEIVLIRNGKLTSKDRIISSKIQLCSFLFVYTVFPNAVIRGISASLVRKRLGAALARRDIERGFCPDIVIPVPDSGRFHAIGYHQEFCRQVMAGKIQRMLLYDELLLKYPYAGRSFTPQNQEDRDREAQVKLLGSGEDYQGKIVVVCDDSIVRGTQTQTNLVPKLRKLGIKEIHFRISNPELLSHCPWGKTIRKGEVLACRLPRIEDRIRFLGVESLEYNTIEDLAEAIGLPKEEICVDCSLPLKD